MTDLLLHERDKAAVRAMIASEALPGVDLPGEEVLKHLARLIDCDAIGVALVDATGWAVAEATVARNQARADGLRPSHGPAAPGIQHRHRRHPDGYADTAAAVLSLRVRNGANHVVTLWLVRRMRDFSARDRALLALVAPAIERVLRQSPTSCLPSSLTVQERRVLHHVAAGLSNAEIADRLFVAPCTVRKHLEHAYRKLGVSNRLAAVRALEVRPPAEPDRTDAGNSFA
jgi:DNA-binding CsgD family transcriptional regulator